MVLSQTFRVPPFYPWLPFRQSWPSHVGGLPTVAFHARRGLEGREHLGLYVDAVAALAGIALAPRAGVVFRPLVFSPWDSATRNDARTLVDSSDNPARTPIPVR